LIGDQCGLQIAAGSIIRPIAKRDLAGNKNNKTVHESVSVAATGNTRISSQNPFGPVEKVHLRHKMLTVPTC
jgi:hypothetical protein